MYTLPVRVAISSTGEDGLLTLASTVRMMQDCSQMWMESEPEFENYLAENNAVMMVISRQLQMMRFPAYGENLEITTRIFDFKSKLGYRNTTITDEQGKLCAASRAVGAFVSMDSGSPIRLDEDVVATVTFDPEVEVDCPTNKIKASMENARECGHLIAQPSDIDFNRHVNNANYIRMACDLVPETMHARQLRVEYRNPARQGDEIIPFVDTSQEDRAVVQLVNTEGKPYTVMEFSDLGA